MIVDDAEASRTAIADYFLARGYEVIMASDGIRALAQTLTRGVDVIIMKATLPGLEGYEAAAILRKISPRVQIILTMEADGAGHPRECRRVESFRCFPQPLNLEEIALAIEGATPRHDPVGESNREGAG